MNYQKAPIMMKNNIYRMQNIMNHQTTITAMRNKMCQRSKCWRSNHQFLKIFGSIEESELTQIMAVPHDINKEIAEYSTGSLTKCGDANCDGLISVLKEYEKFECLSCNGIWYQCRCDTLLPSKRLSLTHRCYKCRYCYKRFAREGHRLVHERATHKTEKRRYACPECDDTFYDYTMRKLHIQIYSEF